MKYAELMQFEPIESVVHLREADGLAKARELVSTYVVSDNMARILTGVVFPHLQFTTPYDNKGQLVVGNYGTGKSHLMAVLSALAEHADLVELVANADVRAQAAAIGGRFKVGRVEIGAVEMTLRDIICSKLEEQLAVWGINFQFPSASSVTNNKDAFGDMMAAFEKTFPNQGLLLVVDELLDYLRTRDGLAIILDLNFLREVGEVCKNSRFRFVAGVQETLFDNPKFQFVAETLRRVKDRFEQVRIAKEDVAFVVAERLLKKTPAQQARIREHLEQFAPVYGRMAEKMEDFVRLFPVHPAYLATFERVYVAEKREVLKTLSAAMKALLSLELPQDEPGLVAYDSYWKVLTDNPSFRSLPDIREVVDKSQILEGRIEQAFPKPLFKPVAIRIIRALSVARLTTGDTTLKIGPTAEELRDDLCLHLPMPHKDALMLRTLVESVLKDISKTVSGQFLGYNPDNGQYYLDLKKDDDYDALIEQRADTLAPDQLNRYYFDALATVMECAKETHRTGFKIWEYAVEWRERKAERLGYLFFGAPNERPNTQPPRDFYLYFLEPYGAATFKDQKLPDEVYFRLKERDEVFEQALRLYAGAREQASAASQPARQAYEAKAGDQLKKITLWLREHMLHAFDVTYQGQCRALAQVVHGKLGSGMGNPNVRDVVNAAGSLCLAGQFEQRYPEFPVFSVLVTVQNREQTAQEGVKAIAGGVKSRQGLAVLDALELLDGDIVRPQKSRYAKYIIDMLKQKGEGQVINRQELVHDDTGVEYWTRFGLEPEFLAVVLAALIYGGEAEVTIVGKKFDVGNLDQLAKALIKDLADFKHIGHPKGLPVPALEALFELLGLPPALVKEKSGDDATVQKLQVKVAERLPPVTMAHHQVQSGLAFWGKPLLADAEKAEWVSRLAKWKEFLEGIQALNAPAKLKNFKHSAETVRGMKSNLDTVAGVEQLQEIITQYGPLAGWLSTAEAVLIDGHTWRAQVAATRGELLAKLSSPQHRGSSAFRGELAQRLTELKGSYKQEYLKLHKRARLGKGQDEKKAALTTDGRLRQLQKLQSIDMLPVSDLNRYSTELNSLRTCWHLTDQALDTAPVCTDCSYRPVEEGVPEAPPEERLKHLDDKLDDLVASWTNSLLENLADPTVAGNFELITDANGRAALDSFQKSKVLPDPVSDAFVKAVREVLTGLHKVVMTRQALHDALVAGGMPATLDDIKARFVQHLAALAHGKEPAKVRVLVE
jgi:hypothetical protein